MLAKREIDAIQRLEDYGKTLEQVDVKLVDRFIGSMYVRQIIIPKGVFLTSRVYKRTYVDIMISGDITITDTNGKYRLTGYNVLEGTPGRKRAGIAHEDTIWLTVHDLVDIKTDNYESDISFESLEQYATYQAEAANASFAKLMLGQQPPTEEAIDVIGEFVVSKSRIHGDGVFATRRFVSGEVVGPVGVDGAETVLGRYLNHSDYPNAIIHNDELRMVHPVDRGHEIVINYGFSPRALACQE
jgi:hypothetical protein